MIHISNIDVGKLPVLQNSHAPCHYDETLSMSCVNYFTASQRTKSLHSANAAAPSPSATAALSISSSPKIPYCTGQRLTVVKFPLLVSTLMITQSSHHAIHHRRSLLIITQHSSAGVLPSPQLPASLPRKSCSLLLLSPSGLHARAFFFLLPACSANCSVAELGVTLLITVRVTAGRQLKHSSLLCLRSTEMVKLCEL